MQLIETRPVATRDSRQAQMAESKFVQDITLYAGLDRVDVVNDIDWHETHVLLKAAFPISRLRAAMRHLRNSLRHHPAAHDTQQ